MNAVLKQPDCTFVRLWKNSMWWGYCGSGSTVCAEAAMFRRYTIYKMLDTMKMVETRKFQSCIVCLSLCLYLFSAFCINSSNCINYKASVLLAAVLGITHYCEHIPGEYSALPFFNSGISFHNYLINGRAFMYKCVFSYMLHFGFSGRFWLKWQRGLQLMRAT